MPLTYPPTSTPLGSASWPHLLMHGQPTERQFVAADGNNTRDGFSEGTAKQTVASAYAALPSTGGVICLLPGRHDLDTGLVLTKGKRVALIGLGHWQRAASPFSGTNWNTGGGAVLFTSAVSPPASLVSWAVANDNEEGFSAENIIFECKTGVTAAIKADGVNHGIVDNCGFMMKDTASVAIVLDHQSGVTGDDSSWWRITRNLGGGGGKFFNIIGTTAANFNNNIIEDNLFFSDQTPVIDVKYSHRSIISRNNIEGSSTGPFIKLTNSYGNLLIGNSGETSTAGNIFVQLDGSPGNLLMDIGTSTPSATDKLYDFINSSVDNLAIVGVYTSNSSLYGATPSTFWGDTDANLRNYRIVSGSGGAIREGTWLPKFKQGSGSPEGVVFGYPGDIFQRDDGGVGLSLYVKDTGSNTTTGWFPIQSQASGVFQFRNDISPAQLVANTDNYAPTGIDTCSVLRVSTDASRNLTGITNGADGRLLWLFNVGAQPLVLKHDQVSTAANRFLTPGGVDFTIPANGAAALVYDAGSSRWRVVSN